MSPSSYSNLTAIGDLFARGKQYVVPKFQREYAWGEDHIYDFMYDLFEIIGDKHSQKEPFFFGPMVFVRQDNDDAHIETYEIVDGQQRLTTSAILIAVIRDMLYEIKKQNEADEFNRHIQERIMSTDKTFNRLTLSHRNENFFKKLMNTSVPQTKLDLEHDKANEELYYAYFDIHGYIVDKLEEQKTDPVKFLVTLCDKFIRLFKIIEVTVGSTNHAWKIFETLNNRGLILSQGDLVKNHLLVKCNSESLRNEILALWLEMITHIEAESNIDEFLRHYWLANHKKIQVSDIYQEITEHVTDATNLKEFVEELNKYAEIYKNMLDPKKSDWWDNESIVERLEDLLTLKSTVCYIPLLIGRDLLKEHEFSKLIEMCVIFFFRYKTILGRHAGKLEDLMIKVAKDLRENQDMSKIKKRFLDPAVYHEDKEFEDKFRIVALKNDNIATYVLKKLFSIPHAEEVHLEHILPKVVQGTKWETYVDGSYDRNEYGDLQSYVNVWFYRLGNMTLLHKKLSSDDKKLSYAEKYAKFYKTSNMKMTNSLPSNLEWNDDKIKNRQSDLAMKSTTIWRID